MEDTHIVKLNIAPDIHIFGVFDGHGGAAVAKFVEKHFVEELLANASFQSGDYSKALFDNYFRMDILLQTPEGKTELEALIAQDESKDPVVGCTAIVALLVKNELYVANAGNNRCVLSSKGTAVALSRDQNYEDKAEADRITKAIESFGTEKWGTNKVIFCRAIGAFDYKSDEKLSRDEQLVIVTPEVTKRVLTEDDEFFIVGCDGIWEESTMKNQEIVDFVSKGIKDQKPLSKTAEELMDALLGNDTMRKT